MDNIFRPETFDFHGVSMTHFFTDNWENIQNFKARRDDIVLASYPRSGNTWVSYILELLHFRQTQTERLASIPLHTRVPLLKSLRLIFQSSFCQSPFGSKTASLRGPQCKGQYSVSFPYATHDLGPPRAWRLSSFLQKFMEGKLVFGSWYDHVNGWWDKKQSYPKIHYMFYEDVVEDTGWEIDRLCSFLLGLSPSAEEKEIIQDKVRFDAMKINNMVNCTTFKGIDFTKSSFIRKGKVGDWKNHFTVAQSKEFDEDYKEKMKNSTLQFRTEVWRLCNTEHNEVQNRHVIK